MELVRIAKRGDDKTMDTEYSVSVGKAYHGGDVKYVYVTVGRYEVRMTREEASRLSQALNVSAEV